MSFSYSLDGSLSVTGGEDGKVKIWSYQNSVCIVTFTEHSSGVSDVCFTQNGKVILSASLGGSVRAHDIKRYRNFRTLVAPKQTQLNCLCSNSSGFKGDRETRRIIWPNSDDQLCFFHVIMKEKRLLLQERRLLWVEKSNNLSYNEMSAIWKLRLFIKVLGSGVATLSTICWVFMEQAPPRDNRLNNN
uniref:Anaphase-promoting complex subunit 4 WD40 domain-containing protein n=1 Tax=Ditylenchus dipsaci TaxID=166011 RepID=A0A915D759_9BILA